MQVRFPKLDFSAIRPHWAPHWEFAQRYNAGSTTPAHIEPYLVKVMVKAKALLDPSYEELHRELGIFIKQEMQHCKVHIAFNKRIRESGYEGMIEHERRYAADFEDFLKNRSLRFNLAYSEGFEAMSAIGVTAFFEDSDEFLEGADPAAVEMWKWHLAEEFEHRTVAHDVYHALCGLNPVFAYFYRLYGFFYAVRHISAHTERLTNYFLEKDREGFTPAQLAESKARELRAKKAMTRSALRHILAIISPFYKPAKRPEPRGVTAVLERFAVAA